MRIRLLCVLVPVCFAFTLTCGAAGTSSGPQKAWNVFTLPNPQVTPEWRTYAPADCQTNPDACAQDNRFWEEWDFSNFQAAIDSSFGAVSSLGRYQAVMVLLPLGDTPSYWNNIQLMYQSAVAHGVQLQFVLFPKWKYGAEYCYLYSSGAPSACQLVSGTTTAVANQELLKLMNFVQSLSGACASNTYHVQFAVWYGWSDFSPGYTVLQNFWQSLPTKSVSNSCNLRASYITWLDTPYTATPEVQKLQRYVVKQLRQPYWVNTELYSTSQIQQNYSTYAPYQTIITGYWGATDITTWARGMCANWNTAASPARLASWTFDDIDVGTAEQYRAYLNGAMAGIGTVCTY
ncbi:MAG TPA: hypothetical protein VKT75_17550 [Acidobacteriaceae bacterium]|nr:hypothetical protein [Acidobacteriaceae bacterium]